MASKLTIAAINGVQIPAGKVETKLWDGAVPGLAMRCFSSGGRTWVFRFREGGGGRSARIRTLKLGAWPAVSLAAARAAAQAHAGLIAQGHDPVATRQERRRAERSALGSLLAVDGVYERSLQARGVVKVKAVLRVLRRGLAKHMATDVAKLTRRDLVEAIEVLNDRPGARHDLRKHARGLLEWAANAGLVPANALAGYRLPPKTRAQRIEEASRRRALDDDAIIAVWKAADRHGQFGAMVRFMLLTAMRRGEVAGLRRDQILDDRIVLPAATTKTGGAHEIPLTDLMRDVITRQPATTSPLLFPSSQTGGVFVGLAYPKAQLVANANIGPFTLHDLRRTCRTLMSRLGVPENIAELAIGHVRTGLIGVYDRDQQWVARVDAFTKVSEHISQLI